jgi:tRNA-specific 2-thiouridylase
MTKQTGKNGRKRAVGLFSGGLDSTLAVRVMSEQGYDVTALNIETPFCNCTGDTKCTTTHKHTGQNIDFRREYAGKDYISLVKAPAHGYGKNMNICIDCRIYMLKKAKKVMDEIGAEVVFTGEVLGQRPMSQHTRALRSIEKEAGLEGRLLRPLSAKLMKQTLPEKEGKIDRNKLYDIQGRSRKSQMELAEQFEITEYPSPAGGCMLADESFSRRLGDAFANGEDSMQDIARLKYGRHFRLADGTKIISGRTEKENKVLTSLCGKSIPVFTVNGFSSTYAFLLGNLTESARIFAGRVVARYSKVKNDQSVEIKWWVGKKESGSPQIFSVTPFSKDDISKHRI